MKTGCCIIARMQQPFDLFWLNCHSLPTVLPAVYTKHGPRRGSPQDRMPRSTRKWIYAEKVSGSISGWYSVQMTGSL